MYLRRLQLENMKCFSQLQLTFPDPRPAGNWCVILGDNGMGKSTLLRAIALALATSRMAARLVENPKDWARQGAEFGACEAKFMEADPNGFRPVTVRYSVGDPPDGLKGIFPEGPGVAYQRRMPRDIRVRMEDLNLIAGYGPFRRLQDTGEGGTSGLEFEAAFQTLFTSRAVLEDLVEWLQQLDYRSKDHDESTKHQQEVFREHLSCTIEVINSLLPEEGLHLVDVNSRGVFFSDSKGQRVSLGEMSDGYRTMFALAVDLLKRVDWADVPPGEVYRRDPDTNRLFVDLGGIVLIDEVDAHLHPRWQREIGFYLQRAFPRLQFIVTTHSPFVAQAATPGGIITLRWDPNKGEVEADQSIHSLSGLPAEKILLSSAFDLTSTLDYLTAGRLELHARLSAKQAADGLDADEARLFAQLGEQLIEKLPAIDATYESLSKAMDLLREAKKP